MPSPSDSEQSARDLVHLPALIADTFGGSRSEARRIIAQGGAFIDDEVVGSMDLPRRQVDGHYLRVGKRREQRIVLPVEPPARVLLCLGPCHGEFYLPLSLDEPIGCPVDGTHPVALYSSPTIHKGRG